MTNNTGRSLELYFIDGKPDGMLTAEVFNWTGHVLVTPRTQISQALARKEARYTGIYLLLGETDGEPLAYVGEGEDIAERIRNHDARKDWWTKAVLVTTGANNLNKAHVKYLEARLIEEAQSIGRVPLDNGNNPARPGLSEAAQANMEGFEGGHPYCPIVRAVVSAAPATRAQNAALQARTYIAEAAWCHQHAPASVCAYNPDLLIPYFPRLAFFPIRR